MNESSPTWNNSWIFVKLYFAKDSVICTFEHPFFVNNDWKEAKDLKAVDSLFAYSDYKVALDRIYTFRTDTATAVYNLEADGNHNYYVSASGVLVHNCSKVLLNSSKQLQAKFKHAKDFGVIGNYNKSNAAKFSSALNQHINSSGVRIIDGTYRGNPVRHYLNPETGLNVISSPNGRFISGWKLNSEQLNNVLKHGGL